MRTTLLLIASLAAAIPAHAQDTLKTTNIQRYYNPVKLDLIGAVRHARRATDIRPSAP